MTLWSLFWNHSGRLIHKPKHYLPIYERHLDSFVDKPVTFFEIGCGHGGSVQMWKSYFGPHARIVGIDIRAECKKFEEDQISIRIGSQSDTGFLQALLDEFGPPDVVIDDGSHVMKDMKATFDFIYPKMLKTGIYIVEDTYFAYNPKLGGGLRRPTSFIEISKELIDQLHARYTDGALTPNDFTESTVAIHFYDGMIVFERGVHGPRIDFHRGARPHRPPDPNT
jgi:cephalosporin hydroxylase